MRKLGTVVEGLILIGLGWRLFQIMISDQYPFLFNPAFYPLTMLCANFLFLSGGYIIIRSHGKTSLTRLIAYGLLLIVSIVTPLREVSPDLFLQFPF